MPTWPKPRSVAAVVPPGSVRAVNAVFSLADATGDTYGGITIGDGRNPRVLVYHGPCPKHSVETVLRALLPDFEVSTVRDPAQIKPAASARKRNEYRTATGANPSGS